MNMDIFGSKKNSDMKVTNKSTIFSNSKSTGSITINGKTICVSGDNISIINGSVYSDGKLVDGGIDDSITIKLEGPIANIVSDRAVTVIGNVSGNISAKGSVHCDNIIGSVVAGGSVNCDDISGNVESKGSINCDDIGGNATAGGSINN